jgi:hypothetical protein
MSFHRMHTFALRAVIQHVRDTGDWIVVVTPGAEDDVGALLGTPHPSGTLLRVLATHVGPGAVMAGRTALFPEGGRVTVVRGSQEVAGTGYRVMFLGFDGNLVPSDEIALHSWRQNAVGTVGLGERPGELRVS